MIFAREVSDSLTSLVKQIDAETAKNSKAKMGSFVVFLSDEEKLSDKLKALAKKEEIKNCVLCIDNPAGPTGYNVAKEADITVILYKSRKVAANHAFKRGDLNEKAIANIIADLPKILESKK
jgi:coenzyme F420-reducing hydrogenase beta subunit